MPDFRFHLPRFLRSPRSSHLHSSSAKHYNDVATSNSPSPSTTAALPSRPPSTYGTPQQAVDIPSATSSLLPTSSLDVNDCSGQSSQILRPVTPTNAVNLNTIPQPSAQDSTRSQRLLCSSTNPSQQSSLEQQTALPSKELLPLHHRSPEILNNAHNFAMAGPSFIEGNQGSIAFANYFNNFNNPNRFMEKLLKETILGAASDSSARDPPPRCHPGTRLEILERCLYFIAHCEGVQKMRWVVGAAGVGKSAIMQSVIESPKLSVNYYASVFLSINGRNDGAKTIITLSYQFAAKSQSYRWIIEDEITRDPSLLQSSMTVQFEKFIIQPFIHNPDVNSAGRVLIIIDGLDECKETRTQVELLRLISTFCISHPTSPIVWLIASRPEPHILSFFAKSEVTSTYEKEEIAVDSNEARADVERFLRHELAEIGRASNSLDSCWPDEQQLWKLANAAGGLFAYAQAVVRYIGDSNVCDPASQLIDVLNVIDELPLSELPREYHPMALLDALYARILSNVPPRIMINARKLLLASASEWDFASGNGNNLIVLCNWLGMTANEAYTALNRLRAVLDFPERHEAHRRTPKPFHKSFFDYIHRSRFSSNTKLEARQIMIECALRVLKEAPNGNDCDTPDLSYHYGILAHQSGTGDQISFSWPTQDGIDWNDARTRQSMYQLAIGQVVQGIDRGDPVFQTKLYIELLITQFIVHNHNFPFNKIGNLVFDNSRRHEYVTHGIIKQIPVKAISAPNIDSDPHIRMWLRRPIMTTVLPDAWESSCKHEREGQYSQGREQSWETAFEWRGCTFCSDRFTRHLESLITRFPDHTVPIMFTSSKDCYVEVGFVDPEDGVSEWTYWLWLLLDQDERMKLGSTI